MLVVDFGTAITYDLVTAAGEYRGGNISPGAAIRFRALHEFTRTLPLCSLPGDESDFPADNTRSAMENGVVAGIVAETEHYITTVRERFGDVGVIFTGGDANYFAGRVKFPIFVVSELVFEGLNAILEHNANL
jgi:type III pantothenate kinase